MKDNNKMIIAMAISGAVAGGIMDYQNQTKPPEPPPVVQEVKTVDQPKTPELKSQPESKNTK